MSLRLPRAAALLAVLAVVPTTTAAASSPALSTDPVQRTALALGAAVARDCTQALLPEGTPGVAHQRVTAPADGSVTAKLASAAGATDWDLALFDADRRVLVASSAGFGADEVAQIGMKRGGEVVVQACRRAGAPTAELSTQFTRLDFGKVKRLAPRLVDVVLTKGWTPAKLEALGLDVTHDVTEERARVLLMTAADAKALKATKLKTRAVKAERTARAAQAATSPLPTGRTDYRQYADYQQELKDVVAQFPKLARPVSVKERSFEGRELGIIELSGDVAKQDDGKPTFVLMGMHHAREWPSAESVMEFAWDLVKGYGTNERITKLLDTTRVVIWPMVNPDGFVVSRGAPNPDPDQETDVGLAYQLATGVVINGGSLSYKRKNCNPLVPTGPGVPCEFLIGVDNNRNYGSNWGGPGASSNPNDQSYRGPGPFSEPETRAVKELVSKVNGTMLLSIHTVAALVLRPPGLKEFGFAPDEEALKDLGQRMADAMGYENQYGWQLYDTTGTTEEWSYAATAGFGYTIELGPAAGSFHGNYQEHLIDQYVGAGKTAGKGAREAYLTAAEAARNPAYTSRVAGVAPPGRTLRLTKKFQTETYTVCAVAKPLPLNSSALGEGVDPTNCIGPGARRQVDEQLDITTKVPASGRFEWWVNPSIRPFVFKQTKKAESYVLTCEDGGKVVSTQELLVARGETAQVELPCGGTLPTTSAAAPTPQQPATGLKASLGKVLSPVKVINKRKRAIVRIGVRNGQLRNVRVVLLGKTGTKVLGEAKVARLTKSQRVQVKLKRGVRVKVGTYRLRLTATQPGGSPVRITREVRVQRQLRAPS